MRPGLAEQGRQLRPRRRVAGTAARITTWSTSQLSSPRPQAQIETSIRSFCTSAPAVRNSPPCGTVPRRNVLAALVEPLPVGRLAGLGPGLAQHGVDEGPLGLVRGLAGLPLAGDPLPRQPADRRVEARQMKADRTADRRERPSAAIAPCSASSSCGARRSAARSARRRRPRSPAGPCPSAAVRTSGVGGVRSADRARRSASGRRPRTPARSLTSP